MYKQVEKLMKNLGISEEEARQVLADDKAIDKGADLFPLSDEQKAVVKKATQADRKPTVYNFSKREKKADEVKRDIIAKICAAIGTEINVINPEREIEFFLDDKKYKIVLSCPRK